MTQDTDKLNEEIQTLKKKTEKPVRENSSVKGYNISLTILTDLLGCIFIGCAIGLFLQKVFYTSPLLTAGLTLMGGVAGLYSTIRYALNQEKK